MKAGRLRISHRGIGLDILEHLFKKGLEAAIITENPIWGGAFLIHSYLDQEDNALHLFYNDPVNGTEISEGDDILEVPMVETIFKKEDE